MDDNMKNANGVKNIWKKYELSLLSIGFVIIAALAIYFLMLPLIYKIKSKADTIQEKIIGRELNVKRIEKISQMEEDYLLIQEKGNYLGVVLDKENEINFIKELEKLAEDTHNGITLAIAEPNDSANSKNAKASGSKKKDEEKEVISVLPDQDYLSIKIDLKGDYNSLVDFASKLENLNYRVNVVSLEIKKTKEKSDSSSSSSVDIFQSFPVENDKKQDMEPEKKEKEILSSVINLVVYTKK